MLATSGGVERHEIEISQNRTEIEWVTSDRPRYIHFDPDSDVFRQLAREETPPIMRDVTLNPESRVVIGDRDETFAASARELANRLMDVTPSFESIEAAARLARPVLLIDLARNIPARLEQLGLQMPDFEDADATALAWTARRANGSPVLIVSARDTAELQALLRPLPHYGGQSYVSFERGRATGRGIWPVSRGPLYREL